MAINIYQGLTVIVNHPRTQKYGAKTHENGPKHKNDKFLVITLKHVNLPRTQKLWGIAHENGHKTRKRRVFGHVLKHVSGINVIVNCPSMPNLWA